MKKLWVFFFLLTAFSSSGQDSISVSFTGKIVETAPNHPALVNTTIDLELTGAMKLYLSATTDSNGIYQIKCRIPREQPHILLSISAAKAGYMSRFTMKYQLNERDTLIECNADLSKSKICYDSWLPVKIGFSSVDCGKPVDPKNTDEYLGAFVRLYLEYPGFLANHKLRITAYCNYGEKEKTAVCRAESIKQILLRKGLKENDIEIVIGGKDDFTYYYHTDGCFTKEEAAEHLVISKKNYKQEKDETKKREMELLRRSVFFGWEKRNP